MTNTPDQEALMIRYLLGEVSEEEQLRLEEQFFTDDDSYQQLLAIENELKYEYAQGGLTPGQRQSFEKRFMTTPQERQKVALAGAVLDKAFEVREAAAQALAPVRREEVRTSWWQRVTALLAPRSPVMQFAFAGASMVLLVAGSWLVVQTVRMQDRIGSLEAQRKAEERKAQSEEDRLRQELASERSRRGELEQQLNNRGAEGRRPEITNFLSFVLPPGLVRDAQGPKRLKVPASAGDVRLEMTPKVAYPRYRAELQTLEGQSLWLQDVSQPVLTVPARVLAPGDYMVVLKGTNSQGEQETAGEFYFTAVR